MWVVPYRNIWTCVQTHGLASCIDQDQERKKHRPPRSGHEWLMWKSVYNYTKKEKSLHIFYFSVSIFSLTTVKVRKNMTYRKQ
jgi:hypothetical protein